LCRARKAPRHLHLLQLPLQLLQPPSHARKSVRDSSKSAVLSKLAVVRVMLRSAVKAAVAVATVTIITANVAVSVAVVAAVRAVVPF
jgi:hypothetical protein